MAERDLGVSTLEKVEAIFSNPALYDLAEHIPATEPSHGGRRRTYPDFMLLGWEALLSVFGSARQVEVELSHPLVWDLIRTTVRRQHPKRPDRWLPEAPMRRHHYLYGRTHLLQRPDVIAALGDRHRRIAASQARQLGLLDPDGPGSWTHPHLSRMLHADGKVITPLWRAKPGDTRLDKTTGELHPKRAEADAALHWEGTGEAHWGTKFVLVAARTPLPRGRIILDVEPVPTPGGEAAAAMACFERLRPHCDGAHGVIYDTALRGTHHQHLLRNLGWHSINRVTAAKATSTKARRAKADQRVEKTTYLETKTITTPTGDTVSVDLYAHGGALCVGEPDHHGELTLTPLERIRTHRNADKSGRYRWYNDHRLPQHLGGGTITIRLHTNAVDEARGLNRTENLRPIPHSDPDFAALYARRNDAESINRHLDDTLWLRRAHSAGTQRQTLNLLGFALAVNAVALHEHHRRRQRQAA